MPFTTAALNGMLDQIGAVATHASLHTADPGSTGTSEVAGGSYVRQALTWQDAASGIKTLSGTVVFQVPAGTTITHFGLWTDATAGSFEGGDLLGDTPAPFVVGAPYVLSLSAVSQAAIAVATDDPRLSDARTPTDNSVTSAKIADGAIMNVDINAGAGIALTKLGTDPLARANHTGTQTASTISDFNTQVATTALTKAGNLDALASASTARTNLGLGGAAVLAVGTSAGTVAAGDDSRITGAYPASGGNISGDLDVSGRALGLVTPRNHGLIAWTYDPALATNGAAVTNGTVYLMEVEVNRSTTATKLYWGLNAAGVTPTSAQNWVGLYNSAGTRLATVDVTAKATSATLQTETISQAVTPGLYWISMVFNAATPPQPFRAGGLDSALVNVGLTAATARYATNGTSQTTLPSSITPASNSTHHIAWWAGLG